jgi:DNA-directed RNA polymerase
VANQGNPMGWVTPMGLPVVQPYRASYGEGDSISIVSQKL